MKWEFVPIAVSYRSQSPSLLINHASITFFAVFVVVFWTSMQYEYAVANLQVKKKKKKIRTIQQAYKNSTLYTVVFS